MTSIHFLSPRSFTSSTEFYCPNEFLTATDGGIRVPHSLLDDLLVISTAIEGHDPRYVEVHWPIYTRTWFIQHTLDPILPDCLLARHAQRAESVSLKHRWHNQQIHSQTNPLDPWSFLRLLGANLWWFHRLICSGRRETNFWGWNTVHRANWNARKWVPRLSQRRNAPHDSA